MLEQILFNEIPVKDIQRSIAWYTEVIGLELIWNSEEEKLAQLNLPSGQMVFLNETIEDTKANFLKNGEVHNVIGFQTSNIDHLYNHLMNNEVQVEDIVDDGLGNKFLHFYDLDGNKFCVQYDN